MEDSTHIDSTKISLYIQQLEFTVSNLEATITRMKKECFDPKEFYGTAITVDACARMHSVCTVTVREYVHAGLIPTHPDSTSRKILIFTIDALLLDFKQLKQKYKELKLSI